MNILGISGLPNSESYKRSLYPHLDSSEQRIRQGLDSAAALVCDGEIVGAAAEERFTAEKQTGAFPVRAINYCLIEHGLRMDQIDAVVHAFDYAPFEKVWRMDPSSAKMYDAVYSRAALTCDMGRHFPGFPASRVHHVSHHIAHASSAYFTSGWDDCLTVVVDGMGEMHSATVYHARKNELKKLHEISALHSIGVLYSLITLHLGFDFNGDEYKIMGLAPYGDPARYRRFFERAVEFRSNGSICIPALGVNRTREERDNYTATRRFLEEQLGPRRTSDEEVTASHRDLAAALQEWLERVMLHICRHFQQQTGLRRLALAGGVALNCTTNGKLMRSGLFDEIYVQPASGDDGTALGAALLGGAPHDRVCNRRLPVPFFGPASTDAEVTAALAEHERHLNVKHFSSSEEACEEAANWIARGCVIAWHRGRMEFGPRALGNRSILADPGHPEMRDRINAMVKKREAFRPFAPAVSAEQAHHWFDIEEGTELPYMIMIVFVREHHRDALTAITHVNGTARVQTVSARDNRDFHLLLKAVGKSTGREMVLNTSFNVKGQPIVNTPAEAIKTFLGTGIQGLFLENYLVTKRSTAW
jgi:carbamoyltransferase